MCLCSGGWAAASGSVRCPHPLRRGRASHGLRRDPVGRRRQVLGFSSIRCSGHWASSAGRGISRSAFGCSGVSRLGRRGVGSSRRVFGFSRRAAFLRCLPGSSGSSLRSSSFSRATMSGHVASGGRSVSLSVPPGICGPAAIGRGCAPSGRPSGAGTVAPFQGFTRLPTRVGDVSPRCAATPSPRQSVHVALAPNSATCPR